MKRLISIVLVAVLLIMCLSGCGKGDGTGGNIVFPIDNDPVYLDPQIATDSGALTVINNCFEGLVRYDSDGKIVPGVAESWNVSADGLTYTFALRQNAKWFVGKTAGKLYDEENSSSFSLDLTADDFVFAFRRVVDDDTAAANAEKLLCIKNAKKVNSGKLSPENLGVVRLSDYVLQISLEYEDEDFLSVLTSAMCMPCHKDFFERTKGRYGLEIKYLISNGPFYVSGWMEDKSLTLTPNEYYAGDYSAKPASVFLSVNNDYSSRGTKLLGGTYDVAPLTSDIYTTLSGEKGVSFTETNNTTWMLVFNCEDNLISDKKLRQALCYGFDTSLLSVGSLMKSSVGKLIPDGLVVSGQSYRTLAGNISSSEFDLKKASKLWKEALQKNGQSALSITISCPAEFEKEIRSVLQNMQKSFGISCDVRVGSAEMGELISSVESGNYQVAFVPVTADTGFARDYILKLSEISGFQSNKLKKDMRKINSVSSDKKIPIIKNAEELFVENCVAIPFFASTGYIGIAEGVENVFFDVSGTVANFYDALKFD